ncbi:putative actin protein RO7 [Stachybotrys elegans]|uniref:Actin protein RO7 n=1 Tax=Stachybotrys elegans TaxID=80388 RepID=A0A8K0SK25_9HYPO|nr:putative actin protein RO7 [Stachybotrys elegans]
MSSGALPTLAHRSVTNIRATPSHSHAGQSTPLTPPRTIGSTFGSPSTVRADDDVIIIELGSRYLRVGFAGDSSPKATLSCGPEHQRRAGDLRSWQGQRRQGVNAWSEEHEMWRYDVRDLDLGLVEDKLDRLLRDAFTKHLLIDSRPRRVGLVLDSALPIPLLSVIVDTLLIRFQTPLISLMSSPVTAAVAAGVRSAIVVEMGWSETVITSVYEYRQVKTTRTVRGGRYLVDELYEALKKLIHPEGEPAERVVSFTECEEVMNRLMWCRPSALKQQRQSAQLETVEEQDETETEAAHAPHSNGTAKIPLKSTRQPMTLDVPFDQLADICDGAFFAMPATSEPFDDDELPVHQLLYQHLLQLPLDVRAVCIARIIFTGGCSNILGIKERIVDEVASIVEKRGWEAVTGKGVDQLRSNAKLNGKIPLARPSDAQSDPGEDVKTPGEGPAYSEPERDPIEAKLSRRRHAPQEVKGQLRAINSLGPWAGGSLLCQLKIPAMATIDRDLWLQHGASGASRPSEIDVKAQQRQSMGPGVIRGGGGYHSNWTLGVWGAV